MVRIDGKNGRFGEANCGARKKYYTHEKAIEKERNERCLQRYL